MDTANTAADVWADSAYRSREKEAWFKANILNSCIHCRRPKGRPMPEHVAHANMTKSAIRVRLEHVLMHKKNGYGLFIPASGLHRHRQSSRLPIWRATSTD